MIQNTKEPLVDHTHPVGVVKHWSAVKMNIKCCKLVCVPLRLFLPRTHASPHLIAVRATTCCVCSVITAKCLQSSHINTCVKQHGVPSYTHCLSNAQTWAFSYNISWHLPNYLHKANVGNFSSCIVLLLLMDRTLCFTGDEEKSSQMS